MRIWYQDGFLEAVVQGSEINWIIDYFNKNVESLQAKCHTLIGTEGKNIDLSIEMSADGDGFLGFIVEDEAEIGTFYTNNTRESIEKAYKEAIQSFKKMAFGFQPHHFRVIPWRENPNAFTIQTTEGKQVAKFIKGDGIKTNNVLTIYSDSQDLLNAKIINGITKTVENYFGDVPYALLSSDQPL